MCCFSQPVALVADTKIFARAGEKGRQFLVYSMRFKAGSDLAMILPIPVPKGAADDAGHRDLLWTVEVRVQGRCRGYTDPARGGRLGRRATGRAISPRPSVPPAGGACSTR